MNKRIVVIVLAIVLVILVGRAVAETSSTAATCPAGTYNINTAADPVCKDEPTGCPYGDSVPLGPECDKLAEEQQPAQTKPVVTPTPRHSTKEAGKCSL